jgi:hypothetical protein
MIMMKDMPVIMVGEKQKPKSLKATVTYIHKVETQDNIRLSLGLS